jgi:tetratricopeptide (TPR) repeat protein
MPLFLALLALLAPARQESPIGELERTCVRAVEDGLPDAIERLEASASTETGARASYVRGCLSLVQRDYGKACAEFERAAKAEPGRAVYHFWFGRATGEQAQRANVLRQAGLARRTKGEFEKAIELDSSYVPAREGLLRYYLAAPSMFGGSVDKAREQADVIARLNPYRGGLAHVSVAQAGRDTATIIRIHEGLAAQFPDSAASHLSLASYYGARKEWRAAWAALDALERARPGLPLALYSIGRTAAESGEQLERAEAAMRAYLNHTPRPNEPSHAAAHWRLGMIAERRGDSAAARRAYEDAVKADPKHEPAKAALKRVRG